MYMYVYNKKFVNIVQPDKNINQQPRNINKNKNITETKDGMQTHIKMSNIFFLSILHVPLPNYS